MKNSTVSTDGEISAEQIEKIVRTSSPKAFIDERTYEIKVCGLQDCPRRLYDTHELAGKMADVVAKSGVPEAVVARVKGPILRHHRLMVAISGCPNSCSQPQIADFGVQGRARPEIGPGQCTGCGACVRACREDAIEVTNKTPIIDRSRCIDCGDCASACPTGALVTGEQGFSVLVGGKLGRHPQLAHTIFDFTTEATLLNSLRIVCDIFANEMLPHERLADTINRIGVDEIRRRCNEFR